MNRRLFDLIYPKQNTKVVIPREQDGKSGLAVFEAAHEVDSATIYWHLNDEYIGITRGRHQLGVNHEPGTYILTLVDEYGTEISRSIEILEK